MKINITNQAKINAEIRKAEGKATSRTLNYETIKEAIEKAEVKLLNLEIPKKDWVGCSIDIEPEALPNSYKFSAEGTGARVVKFPSSWFMVWVGREACRTRAYGGHRINRLILTEEAKAAMPTSFRV